jgi:hypothetical protein
MSEEQIHYGKQNTTMGNPLDTKIEKPSEFYQNNPKCQNQSRMLIENNPNVQNITHTGRNTLGLHRPHRMQFKCQNIRQIQPTNMEFLILLIHNQTQSNFQNIMQAET